MPESIASQMEERQGNISPLTEGENSFPVPGKQFSEVRGEFDQVGFDSTLLEQIQDRQQQ